MTTKEWPASTVVSFPFTCTTESNTKVMSVMEMIINWRNSWLLGKSFLSVFQEAYWEQYGEYTYCEGVII